MLRHTQLYTIQPLTRDYLQDAVHCLAETFSGVDNGSYEISEPIIRAAGIAFEPLMDFFGSYLEDTFNHGLHVIAIDNATNKVVGVLGSDIVEPGHEDPPFEGPMATLNHITHLFSPLNHALFAKFEQRTQRPLQRGDIVHGFLIGVQAPKDKRLIATSLMDYALSAAKKQGAKGFFVEATNPRSQGLVKEVFNAYLPTDVDGQPLARAYADDPFFHIIPAAIATTLEILYIPIDKTIDLR